MPIRMSGLSSGLDTEKIIGELMSAQRTKLTKIENKKTKLEWTQDKWKELNTKLYAFYTDKLQKLRLQSTYLQKKAVSSNESKVKVSGNANAVNGMHTIRIKQLASAQQTTGGKLDTDLAGEAVKTGTELNKIGLAQGDVITLTNGVDEAGNPKTAVFTVAADSKVEDFLKFARENGLNASLDTTQNRFFFSSKASGVGNAFSFTMTAQNGTKGLDAFGLDDASAKTIAAQDAIFMYNGVEYQDSKNTIDINGLNIQLTGTTSGYDDPNGEILSVTVDNDVDAIYDTVKDFIKSYNELLKEMNEMFNAKSAKGYEPLTDEEKEALTDDEVEKWETKIKDALLRGDSTLGKIIDGMKASLAGSVTVNGKDYSLSSFGIMTSTDYNEKGLLHIYGDAEDSVYAAKADKLKAALSADPTGTADALAGLFESLYSRMTELMSRSTLSSALTFYNDKQMAKQMTTYEKQYATMEDRLDTIEDRYYKQFSAMEKAMANMNSQQNALAGMLGGGQ